MELNLSHLSFTKGLATDDECLEVLFQINYGHLETCPNQKCQAAAKFYRVKKRKCYECKTCGHQLYPMKGTVMQNSKTPLIKWFGILKDFTANSGGLTSTYVAKRYNIMKCTAWHILRKIRSNMSEKSEELLAGVIQLDESFIGGRKKLVPGTKQKGIGDKAIVFGMHERDGKVIMRHVKSKKANTLRPLIDNNISKDSVIHHDNNSTYGDLKARGFIPKLVPKKGGEGFNGRRGVNNNTIEGDWSGIKNNLYKCRGVSEKHLQSYLDEFCFRRKNGGRWIESNPMQAMFRIVLGRYLPSSVFV